jgi:hypothetical protein
MTQFSLHPLSISLESKLLQSLKRSSRKSTSITMRRTTMTRTLMRMKYRKTLSLITTNLTESSHIISFIMALNNLIQSKDKERSKKT